MAKLLLVFVIGFVAMQGATPAAVKNLTPRNEFEDVVKELTPMLRNTFGPSDVIADIIEEDAQLGSKMRNNKQKFYRNFNSKYDEILNKLSYTRIYNELRDEVYDLFDREHEQCTQIGVDELRALDYLINNHLDICENSYNETSQYIVKITLWYQRRATLSLDLKHAGFFCDNESNGDNDKFEKCMEQQAEMLRFAMDDLTKDAQEVMDQRESVINVTIAKVEECLTAHETECEQEAQLILSDVKTCMQGATPTVVKNLKSRNGLEDVVKEFTPMLRNTFGATDLITDIIKESENLGREIHLHRDNFIDKYYSKIFKMNENYTRIFNELAKEVTDLFDSEHSQCIQIGVIELQTIDDLISNHREICRHNFIDVYFFENKMKLLLQRNTKLGLELKHAGFFCNNESNGNNDQFEKCIEQKAEVLRSKLDDIRKGAMETFDQEDSFIIIAANQFEECSTSYETKCEQQAQQILFDAKTCNNK